MFVVIIQARAVVCHNLCVATSCVFHAAGSFERTGPRPYQLSLSQSDKAPR